MLSETATTSGHFRGPVGEFLNEKHHLVMVGSESLDDSKA